MDIDKILEMDPDMALCPVNVDILYDGMMLNFGIYYYSQGKPVLLCKDVVLTANMLQGIKATMTYSKNVYMHRENRDRLLQEVSYFETTQRQIEREVGYDVLKDITKDFLNAAHSNSVLSRENIDEMAGEIQKKLASYDSVQIIQCLNGIRSMDEYLYVHCLNVGILNGMMASWCGFNREFAFKLVKAGLVHDLGKMKISPEILNKPTKLSPLEYEAVKRHAEFGEIILRNSGETDEAVLDAVLHHHEKLNGTGYPHGLRNDEISAVARITAISDVYDAMVAERPYKGASSPFIILQDLLDTAASEFDIRYVRVFLKNIIADLRGRTVLLSSGAVGKVESVDPRNPRYPTVNVDGERVKTSDDIFCIKIYGD